MTLASSRLIPFSSSFTVLMSVVLIAESSAVVLTEMISPCLVESGSEGSDDLGRTDMIWGK